MNELATQITPNILPNDPDPKNLTMEKQNLGYSVADGETFRKQIATDSALYKQLIDQMGIKSN